VNGYNRAMGPGMLKETITQLERSVVRAADAIGVQATDAPETQAVRELFYRVRKLKRAAERPACLGFFGPSQAGKSFLVGALLAHELGSLKVLSKDRQLDFLREINPAKGVESTGVVTRFSTRPAPTPLGRGDFYCRLLSLEVLLSSIATGFLVECTSPAVDPERVERCLRDARLQAGPAAPALYREAWDAAWHGLVKKYQDRHPYLNELRKHPAIRSGAWKGDVQSTAGWAMVFSLLWGGPGYAPDIDRLMRLLLEGLDRLAYAEAVEVGIEHVRASQSGASVIDASCLNALGKEGREVPVYLSAGREVMIDPGVLSALIAEIYLPLAPAQGALLDRVDILDFPGGRALKGINGFGPGELSTGALDNAIEVFKRGKLTFLFEQYAIDREITALVVCSPGPTKPEAVQMSSQVEAWVQIRYGGQSPSSPQEIERPSLFLALTKFDMSLGALRSDNARDRWDSRVQEACVDFWARSASSWISSWGGKGRPFTNTFWIRNPYADQMRTLRVGDADYEAVKGGYIESRAVRRFIQDPEEKWRAVEGDDEGGLPRSGVPLLAARLRDKLAEDIKARELASEAALIRADLLALLEPLTPSKNEEEERARVLASAEVMANAIRREMRRGTSGAVFGELMRLLVIPEDELEPELRSIYAAVAPMSIKVSDKVKRLVVHVLRSWMTQASQRVRASQLSLPHAAVDQFVREVLTSKRLLTALGTAIFPYMSRTTVDPALLAAICQVTIGDAMVQLFAAQAERRTPSIPVRLSYSETHEEGSLSIDWSDVSFDDEAQARDTDTLEIVFAGNRYWKPWATRLGEFYLENHGGKPRDAREDPRADKLVRALREAEAIGVDRGGA